MQIKKQQENKTKEKKTFYIFYNNNSSSDFVDKTETKCARFLLSLSVYLFLRNLNNNKKLLKLWKIKRKSSHMKIQIRNNNNKINTYNNKKSVQINGIVKN